MEEIVVLDKGFDINDVENIGECCGTNAAPVD